MKQILSIQDLSCLGKCSLTVALPVLSSMGCSCTPLPTAVLSSHTGFPAPHIRKLTEDMTAICRHWQSIGAKFDAISVGYLSDASQAAAVETVLDAFDAPTVIDPAMADHGKLYSGLACEHIDAMARLCRKGNILLPNVTEAALLTGLPYKENASDGYYRRLLDAMGSFGADAVIITGVCTDSEKTGFMGFDKTVGEFSYTADRITRQCHGTGDLFTAVFTGAFALGKDIRAAATLAARFVEQVLCATETPCAFGTEFETQLPWLWEHL